MFSDVRSENAARFKIDENSFKSTITYTMALISSCGVISVSMFMYHLSQVIAAIHLNEEETTSSSRIFIKILFQELSEFMGLPKLNDRLKDA